MNKPTHAVFISGECGRYWAFAYLGEDDGYYSCATNMNLLQLDSDEILEAIELPL